jgi:hypothetical protein
MKCSCNKGYEKIVELTNLEKISKNLFYEKNNSLNIPVDCDNFLYQ